MSTRDELHDSLNRDEFWDTGETIDSFLPFRAATVLHAEGWRKKPSRDDIIDVLVGNSGPPEDATETVKAAHAELQAIMRKWRGDEADAILALMDRGQ